MEYALHAALPVPPEFDDNAPEQEARADAAHKELLAYVERVFPRARVIYNRDSFVEWGETYAPDERPGDTPHVAVFFDAPSHAAAYEEAKDLFEDLLDAGLVDGFASCHDDLAVVLPFAVSSAVLWSAQVGPGGERTGDGDRQVEIEERAAAERNRKRA